MGYGGWARVAGPAILESSECPDFWVTQCSLPEQIQCIPWCLHFLPEASSPSPLPRWLVWVKAMKLGAFCYCIPHKIGCSTSSLLAAFRSMMELRQEAFFFSPVPERVRSPAASRAAILWPLKVPTGYLRMNTNAKSCETSGCKPQEVHLVVL